MSYSSLLLLSQAVRRGKRNGSLPMSKEMPSGDKGKRRERTRRGGKRVARSLSKQQVK